MILPLWFHRKETIICTLIMTLPIFLLPPLSFPSSVVHGISHPVSFVCVFPFLTAAPCAAEVPSCSFLD